MAIPSLPISEYPDVVPPSVQVTANYPGANPRTIAETVAGPIEEAVNGVENMIYMKSTSSSDGQMALTVTFKGGTDIDLAAMQVQNRVAQAIPRLPEAVRALGVTTVKASPTMTMVVHLDSPNKTYDALYLSNFANLRVRDELARLPGRRPGARVRHRQLRDARLDRPGRARRRARCRRRDIVAAIREQNVEVSAGSIGGPPTPGGLRRCRCRSTPRAASNSPEAFGEIVLKAEGTELTRLKDVARIELGANTLRDPLAAQQRGRRRDRDLRGARRQHHRPVAGDPRRACRSSRAASRRTCTGRWSTTRPCSCRHSIASVIETLLEAIAAGGDRRRAVPADLARLADPAGRRAGVDHRHLRRAVAARLLDQRADAVRPRARDRHRGGRRHRRRRERRAAHRRPASRRATPRTRR